MWSQRLLGAISFLGSALLLSIPVHADLILGVHPFKPPTKLMESFSPLAAYLSEKLGQPVTVRIARDYQAHIDATGRDELDIAYLGPSLYVKLHDHYGVKPLLARQAIRGTPVFHGKIFVRQDSPVRTLSELKDKRFAFGEPHSTMSHLVPRYMLWQAGITVDKFAGYKFLGDHVNVALGVLAGDYDAGAVKEDVYNQYEGRGLRAIATSAPLSDHVFVASSKLPKAQQRQLREVLLQLNRDPKGAAILQSLTPGVTALVPVRDSDYDSLRVVIRKLHELGVEN